MNTSTTAIGLALAASIAFGTAAQAQDYGKSQPSPQPTQNRPQSSESQRPRGATVTIGGKTVQVSAQFVKAYQELQAAVTANDATVPAKLAAAQAVAKTAEERYLVAGQQLKAATNTKSEAAIGAALDAMLATGAVPQEQLPSVYVNLGKVRYNQKQYDQAAAAFEKVLQLRPNDAEATTLLSQTRQLQGRSGDALTDVMKAIAQQKAAGQKPAESLYKRAVALAYEGKQPNSVELAREWVQAYPSPANWSDALRIYRNMTKPDGAMLLDTLRLARVAGGMKGDSDYQSYAYETVSRGFPGEAKAVLEEGFAANAIDRNKPAFKTAISEATARSAGEKAKLADLAKTALAAPSAKAALSTGDALYGYGEYAKAAELYRAALRKSGADASLINLHLGMALARAGDKAGATAAFNAVTGARAEIAKFWLAWLASRA